MQVWRIFTSLGEVRDTPLPQDVEKFERAVLSTIPDQVFVIPYKGDRNHPRAYIPLSTLRIRKPVRKLLPEVVLPPVIPVRNPLALRSRDSDGSLSLEWEELISDSHTLYLWASKFGMTDSWPYALSQVPRLQISLPHPRKSKARYGTMGTVFCRVQRDGKARFFFSPSQWVQFLMGPWAKELYSQLRKIPQDCTFDQGKGAERVRQWLKEGREVYSFDLTSATDLMPLQLTRTVLWGLSPTRNLRMWVDTFTVLSRIPANAGYAGSRLGGFGLQWRVGQPLGAIPSFAAFALTHHALVRGLWGGNLADAPYVILGDDLVIADRKLADRYRSVVTYLGVPISESKSLQGRLGEFAGRIISSEGWLCPHGGL